MDSVRENTVTFGVGPAGTGKTFLAVAMAAAALSRHEVNRIILTRPAVEAGERLGFLPGDLMAKVDPYLRPLFDALHDMLDPEKVSQHIERGVIEIAPLAFMRGRTLNDSFVILDEAQNTTPEQMKMFLTRLGFGSRMVVTGDITQVDLPREQQSGLIVVGDVLEAIEGIEFVRFGGEDVVRHKLVQRIVEAYDVHTQRVRPAIRARGHGDRRRAAEEEAAAPVDPQRLSPMIEVEVFGAAARPAAPPLAELRASVPQAAAAGAECATATWRSSSSTPERIARLNAEHREQPATDRRALVPDRRRRAGRRPGATRELGDIVVCPEHTADLREAIVHGMLHLLGMDHETDDGEMLALQRRAARSPVARDDPQRLRRARRQAQRRQVDLRQRRRRREGGDRLRSPADDRRAIRGVHRSGGLQIVLVDLPGVQRPRDALTARMARRVQQELEGSGRGAVDAQRRAGRGSRRPLHRQGAGERQHSGHDRCEQGRSSVSGAADGGAPAGGRAGRGRGGVSAVGAQRLRRARAGRAPGGADARGTVHVRPPTRSPTSRASCCWPS